MEEKRTVPLPADPAVAGRKRTIVIAAGAVIAVAVGVVSVVAVSGGSSPSDKLALGAAAATGSSTSATGYSPPPGFTYSARPGDPSAPVAPPPSASPPSTSSTAAPPPPSGGNFSQPVVNPAPPAKTVTKAASSAGGAAPPTSKAPVPLKISGTISCVSGKSVEGVWVQAAQGSGYSPWQGIGNGSTSRYYYTLPSTESFSLHVGCGGTQANWGISLSTPLVAGPVANFTCHDVAGKAEYGGCDLQ